MSFSKDIKKYPPLLQKLAQRFDYDTAPWSAGYTAKRYAQALQFKIYGFKEALRAQPTEGGIILHGNFLATEVVIRHENGIWLCRVQMPEDNELFDQLDKELDLAIAQAQATQPSATEGAIREQIQKQSARDPAEDVFAGLIRNPEIAPASEHVHKWLPDPEDPSILRCSTCKQEKPVY